METSNSHQVSQSPPYAIGCFSPLKVSLTAAVVAACALLPFLDYSPVFQVSEGREGVVVNELLAGSDLVLPLRHGELVPSKPILFHWVSAGLAYLSGTYDEFFLRLPSALAAVLCCAVLAGVVAEAAGAAAGLSAVLVLLTMYGFGHLAADGRVDMLFVSLMSAAILIWIRAGSHAVADGKPLSSIRGRVYWYVGTVCGLAMLAKGPLGLVLPGLIIGCMALYYGGIRGAFSLVRPGWAAAPLIAAPWYYLAAQSGSDSFVKRQIFFENIDRFFGSTGIPDKPLWYYFEHFWTQAAPWSLVFALVAFSLLEALVRRQSISERLGRQPAKRFLFDASICWIVASLVLFSLSSGKRRGYLLAILPPLAAAIVLGAPLAFWTFKRLTTWARCPGLHKPWSVKGWAGLLAGTILLGALLLATASLESPPCECISGRSWEIAQTLHDVASERAIALAAAVFGLAGASFVLFQRARRSGSGLLMLAAVFCYLQMVFTGFVSTGLALKGEIHTYRDFAAVVREQTREYERVHFVKERRDESFDGFFFYLQRRVLLHAPEEQLALGEIYLSRVRRIDALVYEPHLEPNILARGGRFVDEPEEELVLFVLKQKART